MWTGKTKRNLWNSWLLNEIEINKIQIKWE